jgi:hypothetical protein
MARGCTRVDSPVRHVKPHSTTEPYRFRTGCCATSKLTARAETNQTGREREGGLQKSGCAQEIGHTFKHEEPTLCFNPRPYERIQILLQLF